MSGFVGIIRHARSGRVSDGEIDGLCQAYESLRGQGARCELKAGEFARVVLIDADQDRGTRSLRVGSSWIAWTGVICQPGASGHLRLDDLEGCFALASYDSHADELTVATDPFGMRAVYQAEGNGKTYVSTSALALAKHLRLVPSRLGIACFLRTSLCFGAATLWNGVERLEAGTCITFQQAGMKTRRYWAPRRDEALARLGFSEAVDRCCEIAVDSYRSLMRPLSPIWTDLTGGFDTRLMNLLLHRAGVEFETNTWGSSEDPDVEIAQRVARGMGWRWQRFGLPAGWAETVKAVLPSAVGWADGQLDALEVAEVLWAHAEKARQCPSLALGGGGEHFRSYAWQQELLHGGRSSRVNFERWVDLRVLRPVEEALFEPALLREVRHDVLTRMKQRAEPYSGELNTTQLDVLFAYKMTGHHGAFASAAAAYLNAVVPLYFRPVFTAAFSVDPRHRANTRLIRHVIARLDPGVARIRTTRGAPAEPWRLGNTHRFLPYYTALAQKGALKFGSRAAGRTRTMRSRPVPPEAAAAKTAVLRALGSNGRPAVSGDLRSARLYRARILDDYLSRVQSGHLGQLGFLGRLVTVELALRSTDASL